VKSVDEQHIVLREIVQDAAGEWIERAATLELQEK
jgi:type IV pilus assembly protein PilP